MLGHWRRGGRAGVGRRGRVSR